jgi:hypothetical protein
LLFTWEELRAEYHGQLEDDSAVRVVEEGRAIVYSQMARTRLPHDITDVSNADRIRDFAAAIKEQEEKDKRGQQEKRSPQ